MAARRSTESRMLKAENKLKQILPLKKPEWIVGWNSSNIHEDTDIVTWMSGDTQQTKHGRRNTSTESGDKYRQVFSWCSGHEDQEIFRRHSLHDRYTRASINQTNSTETKSHLPEWPALADDSQRRSLDSMIKSLKPEELHLISHLKTPQTKNTACSDNALKLQNMEGKSTAKQTCQLRPESQDNDFEPKSVRVHQASDTTPVTLASLSQTSMENHQSTSRGHHHKLRHSGDMSLTDNLHSDLSFSRNISALTPGDNSTIKLTYTKKETNLFEPRDKGADEVNSNDSRQPLNEKSKLTEISLQQISPSYLGLHQITHLTPHYQSTDSLPSNSTNKPHRTLSKSSEDKEIRPRLLVLKKISIQDSSGSHDESGETSHSNRASFLSPLKLSKPKKDSKMSSNVLVYQNDLLKSDKLDIHLDLPWIQDQKDKGRNSKSKSPKKFLNIFNSSFLKPFSLPDVNSDKAQNLDDHDTKTEAASVHGKRCFSDVSVVNPTRPVLQYLGQQIRQNADSPMHLTHQKLLDGHGEVAMATASCEDLCSLSLLKLFGHESRCTSSVSVPVVPELSIPRGQGFRPYNSISPLQRAKNISFRRLHGFVAHLPDGAQTFKVTAPRLPATRIDRLETAKKLDQLDTSLT
ncbi:hypothetical protein BgiMline_012781 [Biomphalaria glabrata]|uniref:Uncharacterized protein LOC106055461 isoform X1 n=1 Tax=Biomphalaria glabrata TaxID=6526 RepID=A0A9W3AIT0_BIOGL|nr:uncharacterized protein LOC106055461 isoform X1 [Biomphalaria glabrata]XP_055887051.1 uncharacterized protein LOC106055461 isoform X1 [Biomphalaria glabrata]XP_055887052.1 uncharacterized protein LOC106055461 isoform X1 [Biomphalaria glabrata]KAI8749679.1 hypothetical protein BgiMline_016629 [Biomphalaria glabrata]